MKFPSLNAILAIATMGVTSAPLLAQDADKPTAPTVPSAEKTTPTKITLKSLLEPDYSDYDTFQRAISNAREQGASEQLLLEVQMIYPFNSGDFTGVNELLPKVEKVADKWDFSTSEVFKDKDSLNALLHVIRAHIAHVKGDAKAFETAVKEAFWLDPAVSSILTKWIQDYRTTEAMKTLRLPMDLEIATSTGTYTSLKNLASGKKAVLIDFWATWCGPCVRLMPELQKKSEALEKQDVVVAGMNTENVEKAESFRKDKNITVQHWLVEPKDQPFSRALKIDSIPRMILVSPEGAVLYNGHPQDPRLSEALAKLGVKL